MAFPGGSAAKKGEEYEAIWTTRCILRVLKEECQSIKLEPLGTDSTGFEFVLKCDTHFEYHQVKRQHSKGNWTLSRLNEEGILQYFWDKLQDDNNRCWFVSTSDAKELRELSKKAKQWHDWTAFQYTYPRKIDHRLSSANI